MSNTIPPLLCSTPPPMDFGGDGANENDDDFEPFESTDVVYGQFEGPSEPPTPKHLTGKNQKDLELPIPDFIPFPPKTILENSKAEPTIDRIEISTVDQSNLKPIQDFSISDETEQSAEECYQNIESTNQQHIPSIKDPIEYITSEPPPLDMACSSQTQTPKNSRSGSPLSIEFNNGNLSDDDDSIDFQINETKYDDNTSLPSLKFDAVNISKSATPVSEDKPVYSRSPISDDSEIEKENSSALEGKLDDEKQSPIVEVNQITDIANRELIINENRTEEEDVRAETPTADEFVLQRPETGRQDSNESNENDEIAEPTSPSKLETTLVPDDFNCDFQDFEKFSSYDNANMEASSTEVEPPFTIDDQQDLKANQDVISFEADFSQMQFPPMEVAPLGKSTDSQTVNISDRVVDETIPKDRNDDDDFEDFQDFTSTAEQLPEVACNENVAGEDDDFGDFNDFQESKSVTVAESPRIINFAKIDDKLKLVLEMMFPSENGSQEQSTDDDCKSESLPNGVLTSNLREIDTAKALQYQWASSHVKNSLIKALGIDSRNILYGEKWNSSMPRFAANLGFSPLEPMKPTKMSSEASCVVESASSKTSETNLADKSTGNNVPAVKFDWNSSGLVNPLDASHAHTLLLDLDQLVVVANLDKIKLDSSSPCTSVSLINSTATPTLSTTIANSFGKFIAATNRKPVKNLTMLLQPNMENYSDYLMDKTFVTSFDDTFDYEQIKNSNGDGNISDPVTNKNGKMLNYDYYATNIVNYLNANCATKPNHVGYVNDSQYDVFDQYLDSRVKEILHEGKVETIHSTKPNDSDPSDQFKSSNQSATVCSIDTKTPEFITSPPSINNDLKTDVDSLENPVLGSTIETYGIVDNPIKSSSSIPNTYMVPLKETHIFTPSKSENSVARSVKPEEKCPIDFDYEMAAAGIVINEQVVKKEYRDLVYNPDAQIDSIASGNQSTEFDTNLDIVGPPLVDPNKNFRHKALKPDLLSGTILNIMDNKSVRPEQHQFVESQLPQSNLTKNSTPTYSESTQDNDKRKKQVASDCFDDEFSDFQSVPPSAIQSNSVSNAKSKSRIETSLANEEMILSPAILLPQSVKIENAEPKINWPSDSEINPDELARLEQLFPQAKEKVVQYSSPSKTVNKPSPSTETQKDEDDWSDFVSVPPNITTINNQRPIDPPSQSTKLNTISKAYDDDDWCDFVSSAPVQPAMTTNRKSAWNLTQMPPPQFSSWNQPNPYNALSLGSQTSSIHSTSHHQFQQQNSRVVPTIPYQSNQAHNNQFAMNGYINQMNSLPPQLTQFQPSQQKHETNSNHRNVNVLRSQLNTAPSISLLPDLGFAAPKTFVNITRANPTKK